MAASRQGCSFRIEKKNEHEIIVVLDPHEIPFTIRGNIVLEGIVCEAQTQPRAPPGSPETAPHDAGNIYDFQNSTEVSSPEVSIDVSQDEHGY